MAQKYIEGDIVEYDNKVMLYLELWIYSPLPMVLHLA